MKPIALKQQRCAIYTRKSTDHNLDLAFNSLDAQREACEAYIKSQAHEGWKLIPDQFNDGAFSGASLVRPALQELLEAVRSKKVDIIVVYKVDRLTRSLADFAKLVELFDEHEVSFVSVTQSFNTTSSMGRLTLNVLLSFAQFEREVIGERVRDKISASKRKGIWVGGPVPLGYRSVDKKLEIVPEDAALVQKIFETYLPLGSIRELAAVLGTAGIKPKSRTLTTGRVLAPKRFAIGALFYLLKNRMYVGDVVYEGEVYAGQHPALLDRDLFDAVQAKLADGKVERKRIRSLTQSILQGLIFDNRGFPMSPSHTNKKGVRYRYYVSQALLQGQRDSAGSIARVSGPDVEALVLQALRQHGQATATMSDREFVEADLDRIIVHSSSLELWLRKTEADTHDDSSANQPKLTIPFTPTLRCKKGITHAPPDQRQIDTETRDAILVAIAKARTWMDEILTASSASFEQIATRECLGPSYVRRLCGLAYLSPKIVRAIANGTAPAGLTVSRLTTALPHAWSEQEIILGLR